MPVCSVREKETVLQGFFGIFKILEYPFRKISIMEVWVCVLIKKWLQQRQFLQNLGDDSVPRKSLHWISILVTTYNISKIDLSIDVAHLYKRIKILNRFFLLVPYIITWTYFWWQTLDVFDMQKVVLYLNSFSSTPTNELKSLLGMTLFYESFLSRLIVKNIFLMHSY